MSAITTHVLDTSRGRPAEGVPVRLERRSPEGSWREVGRGLTDADGRACAAARRGAAIARTLPPDVRDAVYFGAHGVESFYPEVSVVFENRDAGAALPRAAPASPFGYSTYRGS